MQFITLVISIVIVRLIFNRVTPLIGRKFNKYFKPSDMTIVNGIAIGIWANLILSSICVGLVCAIYDRDDYISSAITGAGITGFHIYITDMRRYNRLISALTFLNIDTDEKFDNIIAEIHADSQINS